MATSELKIDELDALEYAKEDNGVRARGVRCPAHGTPRPHRRLYERGVRLQVVNKKHDKDHRTRESHLEARQTKDPQSAQVGWLDREHMAVDVQRILDGGRSKPDPRERDREHGGESAAPGWHANAGPSRHLVEMRCH